MLNWSMEEDESMKLVPEDPEVEVEVPELDVDIAMQTE